VVSAPTTAVTTDLAVGAAPLLEVRGLRKEFGSRGLFGRRQRFVAVGDVSFTVERGEAVALVGESGSGKSTIARLLVRLARADAGEIRLDGVDVLATEPRGATLGYRRRVQMIFQDPFGSLNPAHSVAYHLERPLARHGRVAGGEGDRAALRDKAAELLGTVGLEPAREMLDRRPDELSGGQRQRVAIARALAVEPDLVVADEPTSMLDVSIRTGVLNLLARLKRERGLGILLITHDLASARYLGDRILVLYRGRVVEDGPAAAVVGSPAHPYTRALLGSIAEGGRLEMPTARRRDGHKGGAGCAFASRCDQAVAGCLEAEPGPRVVGDGHRARCFLYPDNLAGAARP